MRHVHSDDGPQAEMIFIEPSGEEHQVRCLCRTLTQTELCGLVDSWRVPHLVCVYAEQVIVALTRLVTLTS